MTVGHTTALDKKPPEGFGTDLVQYKTIGQPLSKKKNYYLDLIGSSLFEVLLDRHVSDNIDAFYRSCHKLTPEKVTEFINIINTKGKNRIAVSKNTAKADKWRRKLKKDFYIPRNRL